MANEHNTSEPHMAPAKSLVDKVIELALSAGGGVVTLVSGLLAAVLILYSTYVLYDTYSIERAASSNAWELLELRPDIFDDYETPFSPSELEEINADYRCWLTVFGTPIDYPVVQGPNDTYYAAVDVFGQPSLTGAIYLAAANSGDLSDSYNLMYGHHMDSGAMFGSLDDMTGDETGVVITNDAIYDVQFFAIVNTDAYEDRIYSVGNRLDDVLDFLRSGGEGGVGVGTEVVYFNEEAAEGAEKLVALSTCANANTSGRLVVIGKMTKRIIMKDITVTKVWDDNDDQDGIRPESVTLTASDGTEAVLTAADGWTATVSVRKFDNLGEVQYTWNEPNITGYTQESNVTTGDDTVITNLHVPAVKSVTVNKVWDDGDDRDGIRPASITATLSDGQEATLAADTGWTATIDGVPVYANGEEIVYTWTEDEITGYTLSTETNGDVTTLTNTHAPETTSLTVTKVWDDNNNQDGIQPEELTVTLYGNEVFIGSVVLSESTSWSGSIDNQFVYENGEAIEYVWEEEAVTGYTLTKTEISGTATTLTNYHKPETKSLTVKKVWDDNNNQDGIRPRSISVALTNDHQVTLNNDNEWTGTVDDLPVYANGQPIEYIWTEQNISGYELKSTVVNGNTTILTNRHETATTVATVTKDWVDDNNRDGIRPESITATLSDGQTVTLSDENGWTATIEGLDANAGGVPIVYTWTEEETEGYTPSSQVVGTTTEFVNTHDIETVSLTVKKEWNDNNNQDGIRPTEVSVHLNSNDMPIQTVVLKADENWTFVIDNLPVNEEGQPIAYTWTEPSITGYTPGSSTEGTVTTLTNTHIPEVKDLTVTIIWNDADDQDGIRPESVTVTLSDGQSVELTAENDWTATVPNVPVYSDGQPIEYSWTAETVDEYTLSDTTTDGNQTNLTLTHEPYTVSLTVKKVWDDDDDRDRLQPSTLSVRLLAGENIVRIVTLNSTNEWSATVDELPVNAEGTPIVYSWEEDEIAGYTLSSETAETITTLTNTHIPAAKTITVKKVWDDDDDRDGMRPEVLTVSLYADDIIKTTVDLKESNEWTASMSVPVYDKGKKIHYNWTEPDISGYQKNTAVDGNDTTFTNSHTPATTERGIKKVWDDADDQDGLRPETLTVYLEGNNEVVRTIVLSEANGWTDTAQNLFVFSEGEPISYSWREESLDDYPNKTTAVSGTVTTITNIHVPFTTTLTVTKVWDDNNNQDGIRPGSLDVVLKANGEPKDNVILSQTNCWRGSIDDLPVNAGGHPIEYVWDEGELVGYTLQTITNNTATILTNTHPTEKTVATITIIWDDDDDRDGLRPESLILTLSTGDTVELNSDNNWTATVEGLDRFDNGEPIVYTWTQEDIEGYEMVDMSADGNVTTITNRHEIKKAHRTIIKIWDDNDNTSGTRPESLKVTLNKKYTVVINEANNWTATVKDLPVYMDGGHTIIYRWAEEDIDGYTRTSMVTSGNTTQITNTLDKNEKEHILTILYQYPDGSEAVPAYIGTVIAGEEYRVTSPTIVGYNATLLEVSGIMPESDLTVIVIYEPVVNPLNAIFGPMGGGLGECME